MRFSHYLKQQRELNGHSQQDVANHLFVTRQTISNWENGKSYPDIDRLITLSDLYHVSLDALLKGEEHDMSQKISYHAKLIRLQQRLLATLILAVIVLILGQHLVLFPQAINDFMEGFVLGLSIVSAFFLIVTRRYPEWIMERHQYWQQKLHRFTHRYHDTKERQ